MAWYLLGLFLPCLALQVTSLTERAKEIMLKQVLETAVFSGFLGQVIYRKSRLPLVKQPSEGLSLGEGS